MNLSRAKTRIESIPEVEHVQVSRQLPNRITVEINERKPVAWLSTARGIDTRDEVVASKDSFLIDANGVLLLPRKLSPQDRYLPIIRHYNGTSLAEGTQTEGEEIKAALDLLRAHQESLVAARFQIQEIDLAKHYGLQVTDHNGTQVLFALEEMDRQLKRLDTYLQYTDQHGQRIQTINLLVQKNVPVTYMVDAVATDKPVDTPCDGGPQCPTASPLPAKSTSVPGKEKPAGKDKKNSRQGQESRRCREQASSRGDAAQGSCSATVPEACHASSLRRESSSVRLPTPAVDGKRRAGVDEPMSKDNISVGLEIGTSKVCVVVADVRPDGSLKVLGVGQSPSSACARARSCTWKACTSACATPSPTPSKKAT